MNPTPPQPIDEAFEALDVIDRHSKDRHNHVPAVDAAYRKLAAAMDEIYGPLPPPDNQPRNP